MDEAKKPTSGTSTPSASPITAEGFQEITEAIEASFAGTDCVICETVHGRFVTSEARCGILGGQVVEKFYGPCPVIPPPPPLAAVAQTSTPSAIADGDLVVCKISNYEVFTTAENCKAWKGTVLRAAK